MAGPIRIAILANGRQARTEATLTARAYSGLGRTLTKVGAAAGLTALAAKAVQFTAASVKLEAQYSQTMATLQSATGASDRAMAKLNKQALKLGADTSFSASEAADAMLELGKAGVSTKNIMGGGVAGTLQLAAAGGTELGTAATIASNAMNAFNLGGRKMGSIAAAIAGGANASSASVESLGQGLAQVGAGAVNAGLNLQETVAALSAFDNAGVKGSDAGTSLKTMLARLVPSTVKAKDAMKALGLDFTKSNGEFVNITNVAEQLQQRLGRLSAEQRTAALNTIFGSDATRAASILMRQGADGIRKYIKATNDQAAAQKMAEARMSGTAGSLERLSGAVETAQLRLGQELAPTVQSVADSLADNAVPAMEGTIDAAKSLGQAVEPAAKTLRTLAEGALSAAKLVGDLPGPVKEIGVQAGIAALVLPRLTAGVTSVTSSLTMNIARLQQWRAEMTYSATRAQNLAATMTRLGGAAKTAAGIGGLVALTQATTQSDAAMQDLMIIAGSAATGFAAGGPIGGAVAGFGAGVWRIYDALSATTPKFEEQKASVINYRDALDQATGKLTALGRQQIIQGLQQDGIIASARNLGLTTRDLVGAVLGHTGAIRRVNKAYTDQEYLLDALQANKIKDWIYQQGIELNKARREAEGAASGYTSWKKALQGIPREVRVQLRNDDYKPTLAQWRTLNRTIALTPKQKQIIIKAIGYDPAIKGARNTKRELDKVGGKPADLKPWLAGLTTGLSDAQITAQSGGKQAGNSLGQGLYGGVDAWAGPIASRAAAIVRAAVAAAKKAGKIHSPSVVMRDEVGRELGRGLALGLRQSEREVKVASFGITQALIEGLTGQTSGSPVDGAIGDIVSKIETLYDRRLDQATGSIGRKFDGLGKQVEAKYDAIERRLRKKLKGKAEDKALRRADNREERAQRALERAQQLAEGKLTKQNRAARKATLAIVKQMTPALQKNANAQAAINQQLEDAKTALGDLKQKHADYVASVRDNVVSFGSIIGLGEGNGFGSVSQMLSMLRAKVGEARQYADLIKSLSAAGLNQTTIQQLIDAGVEGGLGTAKAIAAGGSAAIKEINDLTSDLTTIGTDLGTKTADTLYASGIAGAEGLVAGLASKAESVAAEGRNLAMRLDQALAEQTALTARKNNDSGKSIGRNLVAGLLEGLGSNQDAIEKAAKVLGNALVKKVKDELGIKSPSRVFRNIGDNVAVGLVQGIKARDTYVKRSAATMSASLSKGFGTPALDAWTASGGAAGAGRFEVAVRLTAEERDQLQRGREIRLDLNAWDGVGGRVAG